MLSAMDDDHFADRRPTPALGDTAQSPTRADDARVRCRLPRDEPARRFELLDRPAMEADLRVCTFDIEGQRLAPSSPAFAEAVAHAYSRRRRPRCLCRPEGIEMYVARLGEGYIVKRMPQTGNQHAPDCTSFEPPEDLSGLRQLLGSAIKEDPSTGVTTLKLGFPLSKRPARTTPTTPSTAPGTASSSVSRLSLRGLLLYLWEQADLTRWHPGFEGRRSWGTVRRQLLQAAAPLFTCGDSLATRLYVPETFHVEQRDSIIARRAQTWAGAGGSSDARQRLFLLIAEVKEIMPARYGHKAVIKHVPDIAFALDDPLYHQLAQRFQHELALWSACDSIHMLMIATISVSTLGLPHITGLSLMTANANWLPVETMAEQQLLDGLVHHRRAFLKVLRYDARSEARIPSVALTDRGEPAPLVFAQGGGQKPGLPDGGATPA